MHPSSTFGHKCDDENIWNGTSVWLCIKQVPSSKQQQVPGQATKCVQQESWYSVVKFHTEKDSKQQQVPGQATKCVQQVMV